MFSHRAMPSTTSILSMYTTVTASAMLVRGVVTEAQAIAAQLVPHHLQTLLLSKCSYWLWGNPPSQTTTLYIHEYDGGAGTLNQLYEASETYLGARATDSVSKLKVCKAPCDKALALKIERDENVTEIFEGIQLHRRMTCLETKDQTTEKKVIELSFDKKFLDKVVGSYLPHVLERSKAIQEENKVVKLYSIGNGYAYTDCEGDWAATNLDHPATFETLAMDPKLKKELVDDLDRFLRRRDFYKRVGKAWKRGYLLYGPPGTGKSSLIAAMANYLNFSVYDLELTSVYSNSDLRRYLASTKNRSIVVIEDIDCSIKFKGRQAGVQTNSNESQLTLSGLLNFIDGLYSSCGDERIIVFTTNHKDKLDPALLRPGRMDMHIHMSYCTPSGFRILASNYLGITSHDLFAEIDELINEVDVTPAEVAEQLMKSEDADVSLEGLIKFIKSKNDGEADSEEGNESNECETNVWNKRKANGRMDGIAKIPKRKRSRKAGPVVESNLKCFSPIIADQEFLEMYEP